MCLIILHDKESKKVTKEIWDKVWLRNPHGLGMMWIDPKTGKVEIEKEMDNDKAWKLYNDRFDNDKSWHNWLIVHWRYCTQGGATLDNVHPFRIDDYQAFAHNGTINFAKTVKMPEGWSDSRFFADTLKIILKEEGIDHLNKKEMGEFMERYRGKSRFVTLVGNKTLNKSSCLFWSFPEQEKEYEEYGLFSNFDFPNKREEPKKYDYTPQGGTPNGWSRPRDHRFPSSRDARAVVAELATTYFLTGIMLDNPLASFIDAVAEFKEEFGRAPTGIEIEVAFDLFRDASESPDGESVQGTEQAAEETAEAHSQAGA